MRGTRRRSWRDDVKYSCTTLSKFFSFEAGSYVALADLELACCDLELLILWPILPECRDCRQALLTVLKARGRAWHPHPFFSPNTIYLFMCFFGVSYMSTLHISPFPLLPLTPLTLPQFLSSMASYSNPEFSSPPVHFLE